MIFRVLFAFSLFVWALLLKQNVWVLGLTVFCIAHMYLIGFKVIVFIRSIKLLLWLFVPITVFHGLFTPGSYVQVPFYLPLTIEGLDQALFLCLHIMLMFFVALLFLRLLSFAEWTYLLSFFPALLNYVRPFIFLLESMRYLAMEILSKQRLQWLAMESKWLNFPDVVVESVQLMVVAGKQEADKLWQQWDAKILQVHLENKGIFAINAHDSIYALLLLSGWVIWIK